MLIIQILLLRLYYMWYGKEIPFPHPIDLVFLPGFTLLHFGVKFLGIAYGLRKNYFEGIIFAMFFMLYGALRSF